MSVHSTDEKYKDEPKESPSNALLPFHLDSCISHPDWGSNPEEVTDSAVQDSEEDKQRYEYRSTQNLLP